MKPGAPQWTVMWRAPTSWAKDLDVPLAPALEGAEVAGAGGQVAVDGAQVVAWHVRAGFAELDGETLEGRAVQPGQETFDDEPGPQIEPRDLLDDVRIKITCEVAHARGSE